MDLLARMVRDNLITLFVYNILVAMHWKGLRMLFRYHDNMVDEFILEKRSKKYRRFKFARFNNGRVTQRAIIRLNGFIIMESRIWVKMIRFHERRKIWRKVKAKAETKQSKELI